MNKVLADVAARARTKVQAIRLQGNVILFDALEYEAEDLEEKAKKMRRMSKALLAVDTKLQARFGAHARFGVAQDTSIEWDMKASPEDVQRFLETTYKLEFKVRGPNKVLSPTSMTYARGMLPGMPLDAGVYIRRSKEMTVVGIEDFGL